MHADGDAGFEHIYRSSDIHEVACMALAIVLGPMADNGSLRRKFIDVHRAQGSDIADEAIGRIAQLYAVEKQARGSPPDRRVEIRRAKAAPIFDGFPTTRSPAWMISCRRTGQTTRPDRLAVTHKFGVAN